MAITILATPDRVHPGYNPIYWFVDSTNKNLPGFRYIFEIKACSPATTVYRELKVAPRPGDGYGYADVSKIIQDYLTNALDLGNPNFIDADNNSIFEYEMAFGEEYIESYELYTAFNTGLTASGSIPANSTLIAGTNSMPFIVGDQVYVDIDSGYIDCRAGIEGYWTIVNSAPGVGLIVIDYNTFCVGSQNISSSFIRYADNRKVRVLGLSSSICSVAFNRAYSFQAFAGYTDANVICVNNTSEIITNAPIENFYIYDWQNLFWNFFDDQTDNVGMIVFETPNNDIFLLNTCALIAPTTIPYIKQINVAPNAGPYQYAGTGSLTDGDYYTVRAIDECGCGLPQSLDVIYNNGTASLTQSLWPNGLYDGGYYYIFFDNQGFYVLWYDSASTTYYLTDSLGATATTFAQSLVAPSNLPLVPLGSTTSGTWQVNSPWIDFETAICVPDLSVGNQTSETRKIYLNKRCPINETQLLFMDRSGSWSSFAFTLREKKSITSEKSNYRKEFGYLGQAQTPDRWTYNIDTAGEITYNVKTEKTLTLQTDWMSGEMSQYFQELITSPEVYLQSTDETNGRYMRVIVLNNSVEILKSKNGKLINYQIQVKFAVNENINI